jgi:hypothetical protein
MLLSGFFADLLGIYVLFWLCVIIMVGIVTLGLFFTNILSIDKISQEKMKDKKIAKINNENNRKVKDQSTSGIG